MSQIVLLIGRKGSGKSTTFLQLAQAMNRPSLIVDPGQAPVYTQAGIGFIRLDQIPNWKGQDGRIKRISNILNKKKLLAQIFGFDFEQGLILRNKAFLNGNLFLEDAGSYINQHMTEKQIEAIKSIKQCGLNLFLSYHSAKEISEKVLELKPEKLILKKVGDQNKVFSKISKMQHFENFEEVMTAFYKAQFYGLTPALILKKYGRFLQGIAKDRQESPKLDTQKQRMEYCRRLSKWAHGRVAPTNSQKAMSEYQAFFVETRL